MASTAGLVPITRAYLAKFYDKYPYTPACEDISSLTTSLRDHYRRMEAQLLVNSEKGVAASLEFVPPHKIDENFWKNREQIEEILDLVKESNRPVFQNMQTCPTIFNEIDAALRSLLKEIEEYQVRSSEKVFSMVMTYMPQDFRGTLIRQQRERSEKRRQQEVDTLINNGGSIHEKFILLWHQQMDRRRQLAQLGSATGVYKTIVKYLVGVPQVLLDFVRQINDHNGPMEEQRERYGPFLHRLTSLSISIRIFLVLWWKLSDNSSLCTDELLGLIERAVKSYVTESRHFLTFLGDVFENSPFLISAEEAGTAEGIELVEDYKETVIATGKTHEVTVTVDCAGSLVAWDFSLTSGKDVGFMVEYIDGGGAKMAMLPYQRYESNQGNFYSPSVGSYKLTWDNSYSTFMRKSLRYKVDAIPPVIEAPPSEAVAGDG
ncbi:hypothetical protein GOP47_0022790 [Adiantum capillus-veneris]|uniref:GOLD domain-containing protein n=1 Tax=Adiantum capillus-veneris TaxID=13818 RepID=A0A9D4U8D5_ADICA|nr:hypothetical protein GOP47_0022790 [Adiantum capillus-veneris]